MNSIASGGSGGGRRHPPDADDKKECENGTPEHSSPPANSAQQANTSSATSNIDPDRNAATATALTSEISDVSDSPDSNDTVPNSEIEPSPQSREDLHDTAPHTSEDHAAPHSVMPTIETDLDFTRAEILSFVQNIRILPHVEFFRRCSNPFHPYYSRVARDAYELNDDFLVDDYLFLWKLGKTGRLVLTLQQLRLHRMSIDVREVWLRVGRDRRQQLDFVQGEDYREQTEIVADLDASCLHCTRLHDVCPSSGPIDEKYIPIHLTIKFAIGRDTTNVHALSLTTFCKTVANQRTPVLYMKQRILKRWEEFPQSTRNTLRGIGKIFKVIPRGLVREVKKRMPFCG